MYNLYYNHLKAKYGKDVSLVYMDTDSFLLQFKNIDLNEEKRNGGLKAATFLLIMIYIPMKRRVI